MSTLQLKSIRKNYHNVQVLHDINLEVEAGEFLVLIGPSGCGKSTLLRMIAGLEDITGGELLMAGKVVNDQPPQKRNISMVFQSYALYPHLSVYDNISFGMKVRKEPNENFKKVAATAKMLNLEPYLDRLPGQLSGGQRQRVAMGRAIVRNPDYFLFDEPLSNLDAKLRVQMRAEIKEIHNTQKTTTVYVTHDQAEAMTLADRVVVMNGGIIEQVGSPLELYDNPVNMFVAEFLGSPSVNFLAGAYKDGKFTFSEVDGNQGLPIALENSKTSYDDTVVMGARPENFILNGGNIPLLVSHVESMGAESNIFGTIGTQKVVVTFFERVTFKRGDTILLGVDEHKVHLFDKNTGLRISKS